MRYNGPINDAADLTNKGYVDQAVSKLKQDLEDKINDIPTPQPPIDGEGSVQWGTFGSTVDVSPKDFDSMIESLPEGTNVNIGAGSIAKEITLTRGICISGEAAQQPQNFKQEIELEMSTIISNKVTISGENKEFIFDGVDFTKGGYVQVTDAAKLVFQNCRIYDLDSVADKNFWLQTLGDKETQIVITNCYFGNNPNIYNIMELNTQLKDGSKFSNNYFVKECCTHNALGIYGAKNKANIEISNNEFELCRTSIRIGVKNKPQCYFMLDSNVIKDGGESEPLNQDVGLVICQPYGKQTETFANMLIQLNNTKSPTKQLINCFSQASVDTEMNESTIPTIYIDGERLMEVPIYH